jgi:hypothetical protein
MEDRPMNRLSSGLVIAAALAITATPGWAQSGAAPPPGAAMPPPSSTSAMPPTHRPMRHHATHAKTMRHGPTSTTDTTAQLNRAELARLQGGAPPPMPSAPPAPPAPQLQGGNSMGMPGPAAGGPGLTPYSTGLQPPPR